MDEETSYAYFAWVSSISACGCDCGSFEKAVKTFFCILVAYQ